MDSSSHLLIQRLYYLFLSLWRAHLCNGSYALLGFSFPSLLCSYIIEKPAVLNFAMYIPRITLGGFRKCWCPGGAPYRTCQPPGKTQVSVGLRAPQRCQYTGDSSLLASHHSISKIPWRKASSLPILAFATSPLAGWARGSWL